MKMLSLLLALATFSAGAKTITLVATVENGVRQVVRYTVGTNETVTLLTASTGDGRLPWLPITIANKNGRIWLGDVISGPLEILLTVDVDITTSQIVFATLKVEPESFPPDKTLVIPQGGGANIGLECSTNLIDWLPANLGVYTNQPAAKFFRLKAERVL